MAGLNPAPPGRGERGGQNGFAVPLRGTPLTKRRPWLEAAGAEGPPDLGLIELLFVVNCGAARLASRLYCAHSRSFHPRRSILKLVEQSFRLEAPEGLGRYPRLGLIGPWLTHLPDVLQDSVRMGFLNSSRAKGRISTALKAAAEVRYSGLDADGDNATVLTFRVPRFGDVAPERFA